MGKYILALDQGTTSSRAILFDRQQRKCFFVSKAKAKFFARRFDFDERYGDC